MKAYTNVSRKTLEEDRVAICPIFGCELVSRVKPLKFRFLGFNKHPKCKKHHVSLVYIDERIGDFMDGALACFFDKSGLPPRELLEHIKYKFSDEYRSFVDGWVYCITIGRGAPIVSRYMDTISNAYLKHLTKKQIKALKNGNDLKIYEVNKTINDGLKEIGIQYTRLLKHLRIHSEILSEHENLKPLSKNLRNYLIIWQKNVLKHNPFINSINKSSEITLKEIKYNYDQILNVSICRCLVGLNPESKDIKKAKITAFDRFSAYFEFFIEQLVVRFTKSDVLALLSTNTDFKNQSENLEKFSTILSTQFNIQEFLIRKYPHLLNPNLTKAFCQYSEEFEDKSPNFGARYITKDFISWLSYKEEFQELQKNCYYIIKENKIQNLIVDLIQTTDLNLTHIVEVLENLGLLFNRVTIKNIALKKIYQDDIELYSKRFPISLHRKENIRLSEEYLNEFQISARCDPQISYYNNKFKLSTKFIEIITQIIYKLIRNNDLKIRNNLFTENSEIEENVKNIIQSKNILKKSIVNNPEFNQFFDRIVKDFVVIICSLEIYNQDSKGEPIKLKKFGQELVNRYYNLDLALSTLRNDILPKILTHLNATFIEFNLNSLNKRILAQDDDGKVCGYCGIKKPWSEYRRLSDGGYLSKCNKCTAMYGEIIKYRKKLRLLLELNYGKFNGKCSKSNCSIDISQLPTFDFHHPSNKKYSWIKVQKKKYQKIKELLEEDGVLPFCKNCHAPKQQTIFLEYEKLILNKYLFTNISGDQKSTKEINNCIDEAILKHPNLLAKLENDSQYIGHAKYMIKSWIRKRAIVEQLYDGKCVNCGETNLSSLTFHHVNPDKKKDIFSGAFRKFSIKELAKKMIQEECICLCANCHIMTESLIFRDHTEEIFRAIEIKDEYVRKVDNFYQKLTKNIQIAFHNLLKKSQGFPIIDYLD